MKCVDEYEKWDIIINVRYSNVLTLNFTYMEKLFEDCRMLMDDDVELRSSKEGWCVQVEYVAG